MAGTCTCYEYDVLGRRSRIHNGDGLDVRYGYDALDRIRSIRYGNGMETRYEYDGDGNIGRMETKAGEEVLLSFAYQYDGNGNRTAKTGSQVRAAAPGNMTEGSSALDISYRYDVRGQLLEERRNGASVCYAYDRAGNRVRKEDASGEISYHYNEKNQLRSVEGKDGRKLFTYDRQGGILKEEALSGIRSFSYDSKHRQVRVEEKLSVGNGTRKVQENRYDAENLRFELLEDGRCTSFVYHNGELLHEERREGVQTSFCLGVGTDAFQRGREVYYIHQDEQLGTAIVTGRDGGVLNSYRYDAFGNGLESLEQAPNRIRYTGQQLDELTSQYYLRARYYNPMFGRFMQEDVYQGDGLNLYAYCGNNPVVYYDSSGYAASDIKISGDCPPDGEFGENEGDEDNNFTSLSDLMSSEEAERYNDYFVQDAPDTVPPGVTELNGIHIHHNNLTGMDEIQPWTAYYDEFGRVIARTDYNAGNKTAGIPDIHYHLFEWGKEFSGWKRPHEYGSHLKGEYK
ncbi:RHS repeat domain-containing protein [uncultured Acetatifactor sp.]|uniref:RHS repeat domain-containing protein n=1 Tax=uncultured Acetatifactor sp. TaxID=1671927 RepID=UPI002611EB23|nr:RHS repeat-associated core domain-containing protein [uncultured Acetatifactor sp.]